MALVVWTVAGVISLLIGLVYCELATLVPQSGGDFTFIYKGVGAVPAFLTVWIGPLWTQCAATAVLALVFADYFLAFMFGSCTPPDSMRITIAALQIVTVCISNVVSTRFGVFLQVICSFVKTLALSVIIIGGLVNLAQNRTESFADSFDGTATDVTSHALALYSCMFAYGGFQNISMITEEVKDAKKNIPRSIVLSVLIVTLIYVTTNISYFVLIPKFEFLQSNAVAYDWALKGIPSVATFLPLCVLCSVYGASNGGGYTIPRIMFAAGRRGFYPELFSYLHVDDDKSHPVFAIFVYHFISLLMLIPGDVSRLINFLSFMGFTVMMFSCIGLLRLRYSSKEHDQERFKTHIVIPVLAFLSCLFLIIAPFVTDPRVELLYSLAFVLGGLVLYFPFVHFQLRIPGIDKFTLFMQLIFKVCPTEKVD